MARVCLADLGKVARVPENRATDPVGGSAPPQFGALEGQKVKRRSSGGPAEGRGAPPRAYSAMLAFSQRVRPSSFTRVVWVKPPTMAPLRLMNSA